MTKYLILGGARSGKSLFAENLALKTHQQIAQNHPTAQLTYLATAEAFDDEMQARILTHQQRRNELWDNVEQPINIADVIQDLSKNDTLLLDCLTLWINNLMFKQHDVEQEFKRLAQVVEQSAANIILVSNEVGMGLVPDTSIGREFRDSQGQLNQLIAQKVDKVALMVAALPLWMK